MVLISVEAEPDVSLSSVGKWKKGKRGRFPVIRRPSAGSEAAACPLPRRRFQVDRVPAAGRRGGLGTQRGRRQWLNEARAPSPPATAARTNLRQRRS